MKVLMRDQTEKSLVLRLRLESETIVLQRCRIEVLKASAAAKINDEKIILHRKSPEDLGTFLNDLRRIGRYLFQIVISFARHHDPMRHTTNRKSCFVEIANFERRVVENVEVFRPEGICLSCDQRQPGGDLPFSERQHGYL